MQRGMTKKNYSKLQILDPPQQQQTNDATATGASKALVVLVEKLNLEYQGGEREYPLQKKKGGNTPAQQELAQHMTCPVLHLKSDTHSTPGRGLWYRGIVAAVNMSHNLEPIILECGGVP